MGRLLSNKPFNKRAFKIVMENLSKASKGLEIKKLENDIIAFFFGDDGEKKRVLEMKAWLFDKPLPFIKELLR